MGELTPPSGIRLALLCVLVVAIGLACLLVLSPFLAAITWAAILAYTTWPLYRLLLRPLGRFPSTAAGLATLLLTCAVVLPVLWIGMLTASEAVGIYRAIAAFLGQSTHVLPTSIRNIPWLGEQLQQQIDRLTAQPGTLGSEAAKWAQAWASELTGLLGVIGRNIGKLLVTMLTVFLLYRDGDAIIGQWRNVVRRFFANRLDPYILTIATMTRAVVYGLALTAFAQGLIAGIGYAIVGIEGAALFGALTGALSVVPVLGTGSVWGSLAVYLMMSGHLWKGIILLIWGAILVHPTDNVLRPLLISNATKVPFLIVMFGVIGGLATLGLVGAFLGPIVLATGLAAWREWAAEAKSPDIVRQRTEPAPRIP